MALLIEGGFLQMSFWMKYLLIYWITKVVLEGLVAKSKGQKKVIPDKLVFMAITKELKIFLLTIPEVPLDFFIVQKLQKENEIRELRQRITILL